MADTFTTDGGHKMVWRDPSGVLHACEGAEIHPGVRLLWTRCATGESNGRPGSLDVPADAAWRMRPEDAIDCPHCLLVVARKIPRAGSRCEEASIFSTSTYIACGALAEFIVQHRHKGERPYAMCAPCADHNVRNRNARYVLADEVEIPKP